MSQQDMVNTNLEHLLELYGITLLNEKGEPDSNGRFYSSARAHAVIQLLHCRSLHSEIDLIHSMDVLAKMSSDNRQLLNEHQKSLEDVSTEVESEIGNLEAQVESLECDIWEYQTKIEDYENTIADLNNEILELQLQLDACRDGTNFTTPTDVQ